MIQKTAVCDFPKKQQRRFFLAGRMGKKVIALFV
jgi:hypothetical protein